MAKLIMCGILSTASTIGTAAKWYPNSGDLVIVNNTGQTDVRIDKLMIQASLYNSFTNIGVAGVICHITDENGNALSASIVAGTTTDSTLQTLLNQWKDNVFMTDFRFMGIGTSTQDGMPVVPLEANTRRILKPGQKLCLTFLAQPQGSETTKSASCYYDVMVWYSAAAN